MKKITLLLAFATALIGCKEKAELTLTFEGKVINALTKQHVINAPVKTYFGPMCCGGIYPVVGSAGGYTDGSGNYSFEVEIEKKPVESYRYLVGLEGPGEQIQKPPQMQTGFSGFITDRIIAESYALPGDLWDTIKIFDGAVWRADFEVLPAAKVHVKFPYDLVPTTDTINYYIMGINPASQKAMFLGSWNASPTAKIDNWFSSVFAESQNVIRVQVRRAGGLIERTDTLPVLKHRETFVYQVKI